MIDSYYNRLVISHLIFIPDGILFSSRVLLLSTKNLERETTYYITSSSRSSSSYNDSML